MKRIFLAVLLCLMPLAPMGWTGASCKPSQQRVTYNTLYSVSMTVDSAYAGYSDAVVRGQAVYNVKVAKAYNKFQSALTAAVEAAQMNPQAIAPQNVVDLANAVYAAIAEFKK